jgi:phage tail-like protein
MPRLVDSKSRIQTDPVRNFKFMVHIRKSNIANFARLGFMNMSGLSAATATIPYREGGNNTALPLDAPVLTTNGWKRMGDVEVGDRVIDPKGQDSKVVRIVDAGTKPVYRVTLGDGSTAEACFGHLWTYEARDTNNNWTERTETTLDMKEWMERIGYRARLPKIEPVRYDVSPDLPMDPYLLGVLLAEGSFADSVTFASGDEEIVDRIRELLPEGHSLRQCESNPYKYAITVGNDGGEQTSRNTPGRNSILKALRDLGLKDHRAWEKFIPEAYLRASIEDRIALLRGIMDGDGWVNKGSARIGLSSKRLIEDVRELVFSLGGRGRIGHQTNCTYVYEGEVRPCRDRHTLTIMGLETNPFSLARKAEAYRYSSKTDSEARRVRSIEYVRDEPVQCIEVSADSHLFISHDFIPSHNTQRKMPGQTDFGDVTLSRGVTLGSNQPWRWMLEIFSANQGEGTAGPTNNFRTLVDLLVLAHPVTSNTNTPAHVKYRLYNAWISTLNYSELDAGGNAVYVEQMTLVHEGFKRFLSTGPGTSVENST